MHIDTKTTTYYTKTIEQPIAQKAERNKTQKRNATKRKTDGNTKCETKEVLRKCGTVGKIVRERENARRKREEFFNEEKSIKRITCN